MASIETGVDKLVAIVAKEKKIELSEAAKQLNVDPQVVQEWAEFLEEEGVLSLQFSLSKTFLVERRLSKVEVEKKGKEYDKHKEAFTRKVDAALKQLEDDTAGFESIKKQYNAVKDHIGDEIDAVKEEIEQLRHYEELKKSIDHDILTQKIEYQKSLESIRSRLTDEEKRYARIIGEVEKERDSLKRERDEYEDIKREEGDLRKRIDALQDIVKSIRGRLEGESKSIGEHETRLVTLRELAEKLRLDLIDRRKKEIEPMLKVSDDQAQRIIKVQEDIVKKVKVGRDKMQEFESQSREIADKFQRFYEKRARTEELINNLEKMKGEMKESMQHLILKAKAFDITSKQADASKHIKDLEGQFKEFDKKKSSFQGMLDQLRKVIVGKDDIPVRKPEKKETAEAPAQAAPAKRSSRKKSPVKSKKKR